MGKIKIQIAAALYRDEQFLLFFAVVRTRVWRYGCAGGFWIEGSRDAEVAFGREPEGRGVIQSPHKCIWLIEGASDPQWCTAGAPLIGEGGEQ